MLYPLIKDVWENESFPSERCDGIIFNIPKKGNLRDCELFCASYGSKFFILERPKQHLYSTIDSEQAGCRPRSTSTDHIETIRILIEQCFEHRSDLSMVFMDFEKAFDSIRRDCIWTALRN